jgi:hypothetical protein
MEIDYVNKPSILKSNRSVSEIIIEDKKIQLSTESSKNIFSVSELKFKNKELSNGFKKLFNFPCPDISKFNSNNDYEALWVKSNCYFIISNHIKFEDLNLYFKNKASITEQTGGWITFILEGALCRSVFEKILTVNFDDFNQNNVIRTSLFGINSFILCKSKFTKYNIICPISYYEGMKKRLSKLINLLD